MSTDTARPALHLPARYLAIVQNILRRYLPHAEVWAYGSRVRGDHHDASDLDLVARQPDDLTRPQPDLDEVAAAFSDSDLPILVQIVDWARIPEAFREEIQAEYVVLQLTDSAPPTPTDQDGAAGSDPGWFPNSAWESSLRRSASHAEPAKQTLASRFPEQSLGTTKSEWPRKTIAECAAKVPYATQIGPFGKALTPEAYRPKGVPLLRGVNVNHGRFHDDDFVFIGEDDADRLAKFESFPDDVLLVHKGTLGQIGLMPHRRRFARYIMGNSMLRVRCDPNTLLPEYLYYWLSSSDGKNYLASRVSQVGVPQLQRPLTTLREAALPVPPITEQRAIAGVLGALDDKIEQNRRMAQALERLARAIFRAWFVDFEPVKAKAAGATSFPSMPQPVFDALPTGFVDSEIGPVPEGWEVFQHRVAELEAQGALSVGDGYRAKRSELADSGLPFIRAGNVNGKVNTEGAELLCANSAAKAGPKRSRAWDTVFTSKGTVGRIGLITPWTGDVVYAPQVCYWRSLDERTIDPFFLHLWICSASFTNQWMAVKGNTDMADFVSLSDQRAMRLAVPTLSLQSALRSIVEPLFRLKAETDFESRKLAEMRDYLLPKLLSGAVRVKEAERLLEAAQ